MKVVTCYFASQLAQVSKQLIGNQKKVNANSKSKYPYFAFDRNNGDFGIDIESRPWKDYMIKRRSTPKFDLSKERELMGDTKGQSKVVESGNDINSDAMVGAIKDSFIKVIGDLSLFEKFMNQISVSYKEITNSGKV